jgi:hypothetical protein
MSTTQTASKKAPAKRAPAKPAPTKAAEPKAEKPATVKLAYTATGRGGKINVRTFTQEISSLSTLPTRTARTPPRTLA